MADELTEQPKAFSLPPAPELTAVQGQMGGLPTVPDYAKTRQRLKTSKDASEEAARTLQKSAELEQQIGSAKLAQEQYGAEAKASIASQERQAAQRIESSLDETRAKFPYPEFHPTKDNMETLTGLFSIIGLVGFAMGGAGKQSAMLALNSMTGMMKGWQQGRADLYKREKDEYEKQVANVKRILDDAYRDADRAHKMLAYNRQEAEALAAQSSAKLGGQVGRQILEKQGVDNYFKYIDGVKKDLQHAEDLAAKERQRREEMAARERQHRETMQQRAELAKSKGTGSAANTRYAFNMAESFGQASQDLINISKMPRDTVMGNFAELAGKSGDSLKAGLTAMLGRELTSQDERMFAQLVAGLDQNMARTLGGGYAQSSAKHMIDAYKQQIPRAGDPAASAALFLARFKQELQIFSDVFEAHPGSTEGFNNKVKKYMTEVDKAIPFTVDDVLNASRGSRQTINQQFSTLATQPFSVPMPTEQNGIAAPSGPMATQSPDVDRVTGLPRKNSKGWVLYSDGKGGYAYVSPDGKSFEEVQ